MSTCPWQDQETAMQADMKAGSAGGCTCWLVYCMQGSWGARPVGCQSDFLCDRKSSRPMRKEMDLESYILTMRDPFLTASIVSFVLVYFVPGSEQTSLHDVFFLHDTFSTARHVVPIQGWVFCIAKHVQYISSIVPKNVAWQWLQDKCSEGGQYGAFISSGDAWWRYGLPSSVMFSGTQPRETASCWPVRASGSREAGVRAHESRGTEASKQLGSQLWVVHDFLAFQHESCMVECHVTCSTFPDSARMMGFFFKSDLGWLKIAFP